MESVQFDGTPSIPVSDPYGELSIRTVSGAMFSPTGNGNNLTRGPAMRVAMMEIYSILPSAERPPCNATFSTPVCTKGALGQSVHASFWRPEGEHVGVAAGAIVSNSAGTTVHYGTAAGEPGLLVDQPTSPVLGALARVRDGP